ncbi:MAG: biopolymer transporter ExbD [Gemmatimonadetes bacterium]|nr:biopolymer transporter ExbD [Gemmatimonadota bacterium]
MAIKDSGFKKKQGSDSGIPTSSMADIAFLLLIFFMVTTVFRTEKTRQIEWTEAESSQKLEEKRRDILHVWIERSGEVYINDQLVPIDQISDVIRPIYGDNRQLVIALRGDAQVSYDQINLIAEELQEAGSVRVTFATRMEQRANRARR